jgi:hypothetical protein
MPMPPYFLLADLYSDGSRKRVAESALPGAPVQHRTRRRRGLAFWRN